MRKVLVTGAASGIGKAFVTAYLRLQSYELLVLDRAFLAEADAQGNVAPEFMKAYRKELGDEPTEGRVTTFFACDITNEEDVKRCFGDWGHENLDLVIHSAGVRGLVAEVSLGESADVAKAETMAVMNAETLRHAFNVNVVGTFLLLKSIASHLRPQSGKVVVMGSRLGSISLNATGGAFAYRASKAALNAVVKSFSIDMAENIVITIHPGRVETSLVRVVEQGAMSVAKSVQDMLELIEKLEKKDSGRFVDRFGVEIAW